MVGGVHGPGGPVVPTNVGSSKAADEKRAADFARRLNEKRDLESRDAAKAKAASEAAARSEAARAEAHAFEASLRERIEGEAKEKGGKGPGEGDGADAEGKTGELADGAKALLAKDGALEKEGLGKAALGEGIAEKALAGAKEALGKLAGEELAAKETGKTAAKELAGKDLDAKAEKAGKAERGEKSEGAGEAKGAGPSAEAAKAAETGLSKDQRVDAKAGKDADHSFGGEGGGKKDDITKEDLKAEIARHMLPGQSVHPFMLQPIEQPPPVEQAAKVQIPQEVIDKIVQNARFGMNAEGAHEFHVDLKADVFKGLKLKVTTKDGKVSVQFTAENPEIQAAFENKAQDLAKALQQRGLDVTNVSVGLADAGGASAGSEGGKRDRAVGGVGGARGRGGPGAAGGAGSALERGIWVDTKNKTGQDYTA